MLNKGWVLVAYDLHQHLYVIDNLIFKTISSGIFLGDVLQKKKETIIFINKLLKQNIVEF